MNDVAKKIEQLPGFKITPSHFRIGSKVHISDFYYAKRFFQNSFYSSRMAFLIASDLIKKTTPEALNRFRAGGLSLVGYGIYSELLLSLIEKFLRSKWGLNEKKLNHNLVLDAEELDLVKKNELLSNLIIVVPIATTFSTAIKIEEMVTKKFPGRKFHLFHINVLYISDGPLHETPNEMELGFGLNSFDLTNKTVSIRAHYDTSLEEKLQRFYLSLPSKWYAVESCQHCFPSGQLEDGTRTEELLKERPLFETDRTAVTPALIFDLPIGRPIDPDDAKRDYKLDKDLILYGHHTRNNSHFLFSIKTEEFLIKNLDKVGEWLTGIQEKIAGFYTDTDHVILVSSCHYSNAEFINLVNEKLFSSAATIIHYDPTNDYIQNFEMIYGEEIRKADKIVFVDDALKSGETFNKIYDFIDYTLNSVPRKSTDNEGICSGIFLVNLAQPFTMNVVERRLTMQDSVHSFLNLHLSTSLSHNEESPLVLEEDRYLQLEKDSFLDSLKLHFFSQAQKLSPAEREYADLQKKERHLYMLEITHRIYQYFTLPEYTSEPLSTFKRFRDQLFSPALMPFSFAEYGANSAASLSQRDASLFKALSQSPFIQYEPLRRKVFKWVVFRLDEQCQAIEHAIKYETERNLQADPLLNYNLFEDFKFLIRRAGLLNSNYLISERMFGVLAALYGPHGIQAIEYQLNKKLEDIRQDFGPAAVEEATDKINAQLKNLKDFSVFYAAQIKELLLRNEDRSIRLEGILRKQFSDAGAGYQQLLRILICENSIVIKKFYEHISVQEEWQKIFHRKIVSTTTTPILEYLEQPALAGYHKYKSLTRFFKVAAGGAANEPDGTFSPSGNSTFLTYLWLMYFISFDHKMEISLARKTDHIFSKLKELIQRDDLEISELGVFFAVKSSPLRKAELVYDKNHQQAGELGTNWLSSENSFLDSFLEGEKDESGSYHKSVVELKKGTEAEGWIDLYSTSGILKRDINYFIFPEKINRIVLVRLNKVFPDGTEKSQGLIGFYFKSDGTGITNLNLIRYLHLLRTPLSDFVEKHHENNEFRDWQISEATRKLAVLSGHGKEMLKDLAEHDPKYLNIALDLEHLQTIILLNETSKSLGGPNNVLDKFNHFFHLEGAKILTDVYFEEIRKMAADIYDLEKIEDHVLCDTQVKLLTENFSFAFNTDLLTLIFFELIVNAKKNRWHFLNNEVIEEVSQNWLKIQIEILEHESPRQLKIEIHNTGPTVPDDVLRKLKNRNLNVKPDEAAGTALVKELINNFLKGSINFSTEFISEPDRLSEFMVSITLYEMESRI